MKRSIQTEHMVITGTVDRGVTCVDFPLQVGLSLLWTLYIHRWTLTHGLIRTVLGFTSQPKVQSQRRAASDGAHVLSDGVSERGPGMVSVDGDLLTRDGSPAAPHRLPQLEDPQDRGRAGHDR